MTSAAKMTAAEWNRVQKVSGRTLKPGQIVVSPMGVKKTIASVQAARKANFQVIAYTDGSTGGGHRDNVYEVLS
jgi:hypothetical protein